MDDQRIDRTSAVNVKLPQISLKRFLASAVLIATGIAIAASAYRQIGDASSAFSPFAITVTWLVGGTVAGAGFLYPFRPAAAGALLGFVFQGLIIAIITQVERLFSHHLIDQCNYSTPLIRSL